MPEWFSTNSKRTIKNPNGESDSVPTIVIFGVFQVFLSADKVVSTWQFGESWKAADSVDNYVVKAEKISTLLNLKNVKPNQQPTKQTNKNTNQQLIRIEPGFRISRPIEGNL